MTPRTGADRQRVAEQGAVGWVLGWGRKVCRIWDMKPGFNRKGHVGSTDRVCIGGNKEGEGSFQWCLWQMVLLIKERTPPF